MFRTFAAMRAVDPGFDGAEEVLTFRLTIPPAEMNEALEIAEMHLRIRDRLAAIPGVESVGLSSDLPMSGSTSSDPVLVEDFPIPEDQLPPLRRFHWVADGFFSAMQAPLQAGREFTRADIEDRNDVVIVAAGFALEFWDSPGEAIGKRIRYPDFGPVTEGVVQPWRTIVGVAPDILHDGVAQDPPSSVYWPALQNTFYGEEIFTQASMMYSIRSERLPEPGFLDQVRNTVWEVNPNLPLANVRALDEVVSRSMARTSFTLVMVAIAGVVALVLGTVGIYGVTSYVVAQRTREIGVRMALGAQRNDVSALVLRQGLAVTAVGLLVGLAGAVGITRLMTAILYQVDPVDPVTYATTAVLLLGVSLVACWIPARRASGVDPVVALKFD